MEKFNICLGTSFRFHKKLGLQTENVFFFFFFRLCLFIISGEFDTLHQLSVKKDPLEIQHPKLQNSRRGFTVYER